MAIRSNYSISSSKAYSTASAVIGGVGVVIISVAKSFTIVKFIRF